MAYILKDEKPYYTTGSKIFPCSVSADEVKVDFKSPVILEGKITCIYTESEIKQRLGIRKIDAWDAKEKKVKKVSNMTVTSLPDKPVKK